MHDSRELEHGFGMTPRLIDTTSRTFDSKAVGFIIQAYDAALGSKIARRCTTPCWDVTN
jgi:hypothetical protein